jgi:hypothetical protein
MDGGTSMLWDKVTKAYKWAEEQVLAVDAQLERFERFTTGGDSYDELYPAIQMTLVEKTKETKTKLTKLVKKGK